MEPTPRQYIAGEIRAEMGRQGKRQRHVGPALFHVHGREISRQAVAAKLRGDVPITTEELVALAQWLNVPVAQFLPDTVDVAS